MKMFSLTTICASFLVFLLALGHISANTCNTASLYQQGKCRLGKCLPKEYSIPGSSFCDVYSLYWASSYTRCFDRLPCCSRGGSCRNQCFSGESSLGALTDCATSGQQCCVSGSGGQVRSTVSQRQGFCGVRHKLSPRIIGGAIAQPTTWPWMVRIVYTQQEHGICAGVLVDDDTVLTVAHCVSNMRTNEIQVLLAEYDVTQVEREEDLVNVRSVEINPNFKLGKRGNDLAVLKLARPVTFTPRKIPACLPDPEIPIVGMDTASPSQCFIAGWGATQFGSSDFSARLRTASVTLMETSTCNAVLNAVSGDFTSLPSDVMCTDTATTNTDACLYDDGGMLACLDADNRYALVGLVSEYSCGRLPTIYTRISNYTSAILTRL